MQLSHARPVGSVSFDDPNLVSCAGLVPVVRLAESVGLRDLADVRLSVPGDKGANAGRKVMSLVAGMAAGADSIDDMGLLRHGGMGRVFAGIYAPSTLGSFLRAFSFGHVRQLDAVASRVLGNLAAGTPVVAGIDDLALVDLDDTIVEVHGYAKAGAGFGYSGVRGLNAAAATVSTATTAPVIVATRLRKGSAASARGAGRITADAVTTVNRLRSKDATGLVLLRADSAYYGRPAILAAVKAGAAVSVTVRQDARVKAAIAAIAPHAWTTIEYPNAVRDPENGTWISVAEVAEIPYIAFASKKATEQVPGRLVVRRIPDLNTTANPDQASLFEVFRFHAFFTTSALDTVTADKVHRGHAIIEQVFADLKGSALAHLPSGKFNANAAWLVLASIAFNLTRAAATVAGGPHARATTATIRRRIINVPARIASSARRLTLHLPTRWPWQDAWETIYAAAFGPPPTPAT